MLNLKSCVVINSPFPLQAASILALISVCLGQGKNFYTIFALVFRCAISAAPDKLCWTWGSQEAFGADWRTLVNICGGQSWWGTANKLIILSEAVISHFVLPVLPILPITHAERGWSSPTWQQYPAGGYSSQVGKYLSKIYKSTSTKIQ